MSKPLSFQVKLSLPYEIAVEKVIELLKAEGFGVLTRIDVKATLKEKLDLDFRPYVILGACNPHLAHRALESDPRVGLLLPCNVTVELADEGAVVSIINPEAMLGFEPLANNHVVREVAAEARQKLERVASGLESLSA